MPKMIEVDEAALRAKLKLYMTGYAEQKGLVVPEADYKFWIDNEIRILKGEVVIL